MSDIAIRVEGLSKQYRIGGLQAGYKTIRESLMQILGAPLRCLRQPNNPASMNETIWVLKEVSFEIRRGEVLGIIGPNGAGKTTLLKVLSRITKPTEGRAEIHGRVGSLLEVGTGFHPELTGRENIYLNGAILGMKRAEIERTFDEIVEFAEISQFIDTPVKRYSSGMHVRLAFSVAAHMEPEILLVDEVLSVGDMSFQKKSVRKMKEVTGAGRTVLFVSHNLLQVRNMCTRALYLDMGRLQILGEPNTVIARYLSTQRRGNLYRKIEESDHAYLGVGKARVEDIMILDDSGNILEEVLYHQPIRVRVNLHVISTVLAGTFSLSVLTEEGVRVLITHSLDADGEYMELLPGHYVVETVLDNILMPGDYKLEFGGHQLPTTLSLCHVPDALRFHVSDRGYTSADRFNFHNRSGLVDAVSTWIVRRNE